LVDSGRNLNLQEIILNNIAVKESDSLIKFQTSAPHLSRISIKVNKGLSLERLDGLSLPMVDYEVPSGSVSTSRDLSFATEQFTKEDDLYRMIYEFSLRDEEWKDLDFQDIQILSETNYEDLPLTVRERLAMKATEKNILLRVNFGAPKTASKLDINNKIETLYHFLHQRERGYM